MLNIYYIHLLYCWYNL